MPEQPPQTSYDEMEQRIASETDLAAEARRAEMSEWSSHVGSMTAEAQTVEEEYQAEGHRNRAHTAEGVGSGDGLGHVLKATETLNLIKEAGEPDESAVHFRSPANIK
jgi:hypothetical protein